MGDDNKKKPEEGQLVPASESEDVTIVPIRVNDKGGLSVWVSGDAAKSDFHRFSHDVKTPLTSEDIASNLPPGLSIQPGDGTSKINIDAFKLEGTPRKTAVMYGPASMFGHDSAQGRWVNTSDIKIGPFPEAAPTDRIAGLYTDTMEKPDLASLLQGLYKVTCVQTGEPVDFGMMAVMDIIAEKPQALNELMNGQKQQSKKPLLNVPHIPDSPSPTMSMSRRAFTAAAKFVPHILKTILSGPDKATALAEAEAEIARLNAENTALRAAAEAARIAQQGLLAKPA